MKYCFVTLLAFVIVGCASDPANRTAVANQEASQFAPPSKPLSSFSRYELKPIAMSAAVMEDEDKKKITLELGSKLTARVTPLLDQWRTQKKAMPPGVRH